MNDQQPEKETEKDAATSVDRFSKRLASFERRGLLQHILDSLYGYDYFISYTWSDGRIYALALAEQLQKLHFTCFLDSEDYLKGDNWKSVGERALKKSTRLVLVGSPKVHQSDPVLRELRVFTATGKSVIPINFVTDLEDRYGSLNGPRSGQSPLAPYLDRDAIWINEKIGRLSHGPEAVVVEQLQKSFMKQRRSQKRARTLRIVMCVVSVLIAVAGWAAWMNDRSKTEDMVTSLMTDLVADDRKKEELSSAFTDLLTRMNDRRCRVVSELRSQQKKFQWSANDEVDRFAKQRAHAAIVLVHFHEFDLARNYLNLDGRPEPLAQFAARCRTPGGLKSNEVIDFARKLINKDPLSGNPGIALEGYSALLGVGEYQDPDAPRKNQLPGEFLDELETWYCNHPSAAIHNACGWLLAREENGREVVEKLNERIAHRPAEMTLEPGKDWLVVELGPETGNKQGSHREYITFVIFKDKFKDKERVFAVADRETTIGVCDQLGAKPLYSYPDENPETIDPLNDVIEMEEDEKNARDICKRLSGLLPKTLKAGFPDESQWAIAWGNPGKDKTRRFQFGKDRDLLKRYANVDPDKEFPGPVAVHCPSSNGMFDIHGNVAEWTIASIENPSEFRLRGGAVGQNLELCEWNIHFDKAQNKGFRFCITLVAEEQPGLPPGR